MALHLAGGVIAGLVLLASTLPAGYAHPASAHPGHPEVVTYKGRRCECCTGWVEHMRTHGFRVVVRDTTTPARLAIQARLGVPDSLSSCHTSVIGRYVVQGHVPASDVQRLLTEQPAVVGIGVAFMPAGSPGMESSTPVPYTVIAFTRDSSWVYARH